MKRRDKIPAAASATPTPPSRTWGQGQQDPNSSETFRRCTDGINLKIICRLVLELSCSQSSVSMKGDDPQCFTAEGLRKSMTNFSVWWMLNGRVLTSGFSIRSEHSKHFIQPAAFTQTLFLCFIYWSAFYIPLTQSYSVGCMGEQLSILPKDSWHADQRSQDSNHQLSD